MGLAVATSVTTNVLRSDAVEAMAPALTEPLSQSKLSSSAASGASPRTSSSTTTTSTLGTTLASTDAVTSYVDTDPVTVQPNQQAAPPPPPASSESAPAEALITEGTAVCSSTEAVTAGNSSTFVPQAGLTAETVAPLPVASGAEEVTIGGTTVDDIQNNNSNGGPGALKRLPEKDRDLIELALEQIHQEASIDGSTAGSIPAMGAHPVPAGSTVLDGLDKATISSTPTSMSMPVNILQPAAAAGSSVQIPIDMANTPIVLSTATGETLQALSNTPQPVQQASALPPLPPPSQQELLHVPVQDSSQSSIGAGSELGLQKDYLKESAEMDQMIHELSTADIDLLQVLKSFDGSGLLLFSDVDVANLCDGPDGTSGLAAAAASPNKDRERLELHAEIVKRQLQMQRKYDFLMRRLNKLAARYMGQHVSEETAGLFEYVQRYWKKREKEHAKQQLQFNHPNATTSTAPTTSMTPATGGQQWPDIIPYQAPSAGDQQPEKLKPISANALKTFTKRLEGISNTICSAQSKRIRYSRYFTGVNNIGGPSAEQPSVAGGGYGNISNTIPLFEKGAIAELEQTAGLLHAELRQVQTNIDSDATLSSSGGESADESVPYTNTSQLPLAIPKRALWKWSKDRAAVASRWTWLLSRVADLEYRIRQHNELLMKIRVNKGPITLEDPIPEASNAGGNTTNQPQSVNGYRGQLPGSNKPLTTDSAASITDDEEDVTSCSRSRPYNREKFRKRKLLQTPNLHIISKRAARPSNIKCGCQWPLQPCALCTGRPDPTAPRDPPATMPFAERVALLDSSYHPVLSFPEDTSHSIHLEAIMRLPEVQNRMIRTTHTSSSTGMGSTKHGTSSSYKTLSTSSSRAGGANASFFSSGDEGDHSAHGKRYISSDGKRKAESSSSNKYKSNDRSFTDGGNKSKKSKSRRDVLQNNRKSGHGTQAMTDGSGYKLSGSNGHYYKNSHQSKSRKSSHSYDHHGDGLQDGTGNVSRSKNSSPTPNNQRNEKRHRISYDIDNIVIPYSMAASNRISLPQYKDIAIPKWRIVDDEEDDGAPEQTEISQLNTPTKASSQDALSPASSATTATASESCSIVLTAESVVTEGASGDEKSETKPSTQPPNGTKASSSSTSSKLVGDSSTLSTGAGNSVESQQQQLIVIPAQDEEDISEESIQLKHERALQEERKKFQTYMKFPWSRPRANRRTESRAGSSGANTPDPPSPAPPTTMVDHDSSPTCPSTPLTPQDGQMLSETNVINAINKSLHKKERRRTVSSKRDEQQQQQQHAQQATGSNTPPDAREIVNPYESLQFPLADEVYEQMLRTMPSDHVTMVDDDCLIEKLPRSRHPNNNVLLVLKSSMDLAPASLGISAKNPLSSNVSCSSTTMSVNETDLEEFDDEDLMLAKRTENQRIMERLLNSRDASQRYEIVPPTAKPMLDEDEQLDDEETDTGESLFVEEDDPNDPEWYDRPPGRVGGSGGGANASGRS